MASASVETKRRALGLLLIELENLRQHGFSGLLCLAVDGQPPAGCSETCPLLAFVPAKSGAVETPCRQIPLNDKGETVESIAETRNAAYLEEQLVAWMERTALQLQRELREASSG